MLTVESAGIARGGRWLLDRVSLELKGGRLVAIVGPNGSGKSSLVKAITGEWRLARGRIALDGRDIAAMSAGELAGRRAVVPQSTPLAFPFTVLDVVMLGMTVPGFSIAGSPEVALDALDDVGLAGFERRFYTALSGGERQRVHIARALAQLRSRSRDDGTHLLILDEPTASLDPGHAALVLDLLLEEAERGICVIVVLHDLNLAAGWAHEVVLVDAGRIVRHGPPALVLEEGLLSEAYRCAIQVNTVPGVGMPFVLPHGLRNVGRKRTEAKVERRGTACD